MSFIYWLLSDIVQKSFRGVAPSCDGGVYTTETFVLREKTVLGVSGFLVLVSLVTPDLSSSLFLSLLHRSSSYSVPSLNYVRV